MRVLQVHNRYRLRGGEDAVVDATMALLVERGVEARLFTRDSEGMHGLAAKIRSVFSAVYSRESARAITAEIKAFQPDVVHVHNVFPLISPSVFDACAAAGVPAVMTVHNYRLTCPIGVHFVRGAVCTKCLGGHEEQCALNNCRGSRFESAAYAFRGKATRLRGGFTRNVSAYIAISHFLKGQLVDAGFPAEKIAVVHNMAQVPERAGDAAQGQYAAFVGRLSDEKGVDTLIAAAKLAPEIPVRIAGGGELREALERGAPANVRFVGMLDRGALADFYANARFAVVPSAWWETFGLVAVEAMGHGLPVVSARMGALPEIVQDGETGLLFPAGDAQALAQAMRTLWNEPATCAAMGAAGRVRAASAFSRDRYFEGLMNVYQRVIARENAA